MRKKTLSPGHRRDLAQQSGSGHGVQGLGRRGSFINRNLFAGPLEPRLEIPDQIAIDLNDFLPGVCPIKSHPSIERAGGSEDVQFHIFSEMLPNITIFYVFAHYSFHISLSFFRGLNYPQMLITSHIRLSVAIILFGFIFALRGFLA